LTYPPAKSDDIQTLLNPFPQPHGKRMRAFIAIPIPLPIKQRLESCARRLKNSTWGEHLIWYPSDQYHITLHFLGGHLQADKLQTLIATMPDWPAWQTPSFSLNLQTVDVFPDPDRPHTLVGTLAPSEPLLMLYDSLCQPLRELGLQPSRQPFSPHISLARIPKNALAQQDSSQLPCLLDNLNFTVKHVVLYQSQLTAKAPIYTPLQQVRLF
jgi:2'-5' RNA ligase